jgi:hypothetical protein
MMPSVPKLVVLHCQVRRASALKLINGRFPVALVTLT